ncbi:MAG: site-specific integrase [Firmicutes bacterium]|nr:site-specific integrase [Bacillota bacterium]
MNTQESLKERIIQYINYIDIKPATKESYQRILFEYVSYIDNLPNLPTRHDVMKYRDRIKNRLKAASVQKHIVVIRNFYRWFYIEGYGPNIAEGIKGMKIESNFKREALSVVDSKKLLHRAEIYARKDVIGLRNYALISLLLTTGMRTIEVERSDTEDIDFIEDSQVLFVMGKGHDDKDTYVKLSPQVYAIIEEYLIKRSDEFKPLFINHGHTNYGERMQTRSIRAVVKEYLRQIGIDSPKYSAHSLRHTTATLSLLEGAGIESTQQLLRHKDPATTQIYIHKMNRRKENYEGKISDTLFGKTTRK